MDPKKGIFSFDFPFQFENLQTWLVKVIFPTLIPNLVLLSATITMKFVQEELDNINIDAAIRFSLYLETHLVLTLVT